MSGKKSKKKKKGREKETKRKNDGERRGGEERTTRGGDRPRSLIGDRRSPLRVRPPCQAWPSALSIVNFPLTSSCPSRAVQSPTYPQLPHSPAAPASGQASVCARSAPLRPASGSAGLSPAPSPPPRSSGRQARQRADSARAQTGRGTRAERKRYAPRSDDDASSGTPRIANAWVDRTRARTLPPHLLRAGRHPPPPPPSRRPAHRTAARRAPSIRAASRQAASSAPTRRPSSRRLSTEGLC